MKNSVFILFLFLVTLLFIPVIKSYCNTSLDTIERTQSMLDDDSDDDSTFDNSDYILQSFKLTILPRQIIKIETVTHNRIWDETALSTFTPPPQDK